MGHICLNLSTDWATALVAATAAHLGFQLTVTTLVYPTLAEVEAERWVRQHDQHSRRGGRQVGVPADRRVRRPAAHPARHRPEPDVDAAPAGRDRARCVGAAVALVFAVLSS